MRELTSKEKKKLKGVANVALAVGSLAVIAVMVVKCNKKIGKAAKEVKEVLLPDEPLRSVDEDIFTSLATELENAVLDKGTADTTLTRFYTVSDEDWKLVTVNIRKVVVE